MNSAQRRRARRATRQATWEDARMFLADARHFERWSRVADLWLRWVEMCGRCDGRATEPTACRACDGHGVRVRYGCRVPRRWARFGLGAQGMR